MIFNSYIIEITTSEALNHVFFTSSGNRDFVYRGHTDSTWRLQSTLERKLEKLKNSNIDIREYEKKVIEASRAQEKILTPIQIMAEMQHYGGATRLIDFTLAFEIALFFAFCDFPTKAASVWAISKNNLPFIGESQILEHRGELSLFELDFQRALEEQKVFDFYYNNLEDINYRDRQELIKETMDTYPKEMEEYKIGALDFLTSKEYDFNFSYQRKHGLQGERPGEISPRQKYIEESLNEYFYNNIKNPRLFEQKGLFLFSSNIEKAFEENLFFRRDKKDIEKNTKHFKNPNYKDLNELFCEAYTSQRGIIHFKIDSSLTNYVLKTLKSGNYDILLPDFDSTNSNEENLKINHERLNITPVTFKTLYPDKIGKYKDLTHKLLNSF
ncbi:MAG: FRG domain-containing protein [Promethearchaeota archaeon]